MLKSAVIVDLLMLRCSPITHACYLPRAPSVSGLRTLGGVTVGITRSRPRPSSSRQPGDSWLGHRLL